MNEERVPIWVFVLCVSLGTIAGCISGIHGERVTKQKASPDQYPKWAAIDVLSDRSKDLSSECRTLHARHIGTEKAMYTIEKRLDAIEEARGKR